MRHKYNRISKVIISALWLMATAYGVYYLVVLIKESVEGGLTWTLPHNSTSNLLLFTAILLLMGLNWSIEALKWKYAVKDIEQLSFVNALKATMAGVAISTWMPNRIGEYLGKVFYLQNSNRYKGAISGLYVSYTQIIATSFFGIIGAVFFITQFKTANGLMQQLLWLTLVLIVLVLVVLFKNSILKSRIFQNKHVSSFVNTLGRYQLKDTLLLIALSALRFSVFACQFVLALSLFGINAPFISSFLVVSLIYGIQTVMPASAIAGLGIRGALSVYFIGFLVNNETAILSATYCIWVVNLLIPSGFGIIGLITSPVRHDVKNLALSWIKPNK